MSGKKVGVVTYARFPAKQVPKLPEKGSATTKSPQFFGAMFHSSCSLLRLPLEKWKTMSWSQKQLVAVTAVYTGCPCHVRGETCFPDHPAPHPVCHTACHPAPVNRKDIWRSAPRKIGQGSGCAARICKDYEALRSCREGLYINPAA